MRSYCQHGVERMMETACGDPTSGLANVEELSYRQREGKEVQ